MAAGLFPFLTGSLQDLCFIYFEKRLSQNLFSADGILPVLAFWGLSLLL